MKETAVQLLKRILEGQKDEPFDYDEWCISFDYAEDTEKEQMEEIREMLVQGALTNMSCASAVVEFDRLTKQQKIMKQTAVEWLVEKLTNGHYLDEGMKQKIIEQAKEMEKEQISDKVLFEQATVAMEEHYGYDCETEIDAYFRGAKWMQKNIYTEEQVREAMEFARGYSKMTDTQFIETLK